MKRRWIVYAMSATLSTQVWSTNYTWNTSTANQTWGTNANWNPNTGHPSLAADQAIFDGTGIGTPIIVDGTYPVGSLVFGSVTSTIPYTLTSQSGSAYSLQLGGGAVTNLISVTGSANQTISVPLQLVGNLTISQGGSGVLLINGGISQSYGLSLSGTGYLQLGGANTYTGTTTIGSSAYLQIVNGCSFTTSPFSVTGTLDLNGQNLTIYSLSGSGTVSNNNLQLTVIDGGTFSGPISGSGALVVGNGISTATLTLSHTNSYSGGTTIETGAILALSGAGALNSSGSVNVLGTFDISGVTSSATIGDLSGSGDISLGSKTLTFGTSNDVAFSGSISSTTSGGSIVKTGSGIATFSLPSTYYGSTTISAGTLLANAENILSSNSAFTVNSPGILSLNYSNTVYSLSGSGFVELNTPSTTLFVNNTGSFSGQILGTGALTIGNGSTTPTLTLSNANSYSGGTTIETGAILALSSSGALNSSGSVNVLGTFDISTITSSTTIGDLNGSGTINLGNKTLTFGTNNNEIFSGSISSTTSGGSIVKIGGGMETFSSASTYYGTTTISNGTILASAANVLSSQSNFTINSPGTLTVDYSNTINSLNGSGFVFINNSSTTLSITDGGSFSGQIEGTGILAIGNGATAETLTLSNACSYGGGTNILASATLALSGKGNLASSAPVTIAGTGTSAGTFDISAITDTSLTIGNLSGSGIVNLGAKTLVFGTAVNETFSGYFAGTTSAGSLIKNGDGTQTFSGSTPSTYSGSTEITNGTLVASTANVLSNQSDFIVNSLGTLTLNANNAIHSLSGSGDVVLNSSTITISNSGTFNGQISGSGSLTLNGGTLTLTNASSYSGGTTIGASADLLLDSDGLLLDTGSVNVLGTFDISSMTASSTTIGNLSGSGTIDLGGKELVFGTNSTSPTTYSGKFIGSTGSLTKDNTGTAIFSGTGSTYTGTTIIKNGILEASASNVLSSLSEFEVDEYGTLQLDANNTINSLSGEGNVSLTSSSILTIDLGGTFDGGISGDGGIDLVDGTLTLTEANSFTGGSTIENGAALVLSGDGSLYSQGAVVDDGTFDIQNVTSPISIGNLTGASTGTVNLGAQTLILHTTGSTFSGAIQGTGGSLTLYGTGTLSLGGATNSYSGTTTIESGATLQALINNAFSANSAFTVTDVLDLNNYNNTIKSLNGSGTVLTGSGSGGTLTITNGGTFTGQIQQNGGITLTGSSLTLTPSGSNSYSGQTVINSGATLSAGNSSALSSSSAFSVNGTLDLQNNSNQISTISGSGTILTGSGSGGTLTIANGGIFNGQIQQNGGITLTAGTLNLAPLSGANSYSGQTTINDGGTLMAVNANALSPSSAFVLNSSATLSLNANNTIASLSSNSTYSTVNLGASILTISGGASTAFKGHITNLCGGLTIDGGSILTLDGTNNDYCGATSIVNGTLNIEEAGALSPATAISVSSSGTLNFGNYANPALAPTTSLSLTSSGTVNNIGRVTIPTILINGGTLSNTGSGTILEGDAITIAGGVVTNGDYTTLSTQLGNSSTTLTLNGGTLINNATVLCSTYSQTAAATLQVGFFGATSIQTGLITGTGLMSLGNGTLYLKHDTGSYQPVIGDYSTILTTMGALNGYFSNVLWSSDFALTPRVVYSLQDVNVFFGGNTNYWNYPGDGNWANAHNWLSENIPGIQGNTNDIANFVNISGPSAITVTLANSEGTAPQSVTLLQLNFLTDVTSYTIQEYSNLSTITFDSSGSALPQITVTAGSHTINAAIQLNKDTNLVLSDSAALRFGSDVALYSNQSQTFTVTQSSGSGTGQLVNDGTITPAYMVVSGGQVVNDLLINPTHDLTIGSTGVPVTFTNLDRVIPQGMAVIGDSGTTTVYNSAISATFEPVGDLTIGGSGITYVENSGTDAVFGPSANNSDLNVIGTGTTTVTNNGANAKLGPLGMDAIFAIQPPGGITTINNIGSGSQMGAFGDGSQLIIGTSGGLNLANVNNNGLDVRLGAFGVGGTVAVHAGTIQNTNGAIFSAGYGGSLTIDGGTAINDLTSTTGSSTANLILTGNGFLNNYGNVIAFDFTQNGTSTLQLNLTNMPDVFGNIYASGTAQLGTNLTVVALPNSNVAPEQVVDLLIANRGVIGTFSNVNFLGFPDTIIPAIFYTPTTVELGLASTVTPNPSGSLGSLTGSIANATNFILERHLFELHKRVKKKKRNQILSLLAENEMSINVKRKQAQLVRKIETEETVHPWRVYVGPRDLCGSFRSKSTAQTGFGYNTVGILGGADYASTNLGLGAAVDYVSVDAKVRHHAGFAYLDQIHGCIYGTLVPPNHQELAINAIVGGGYDWYTTKRQAGISFSPIEAKGKCGGAEFDALLGAEWILAKDVFGSIPEHFSITPLANVQYVYPHVKKNHERGGGIYDLEIQVPHMKFLWSTVGARLNYEIAGEKISFQPELDFGWQYQYLNQHNHVDFSTIALPQTKYVSIPVLGIGHNTLWAGADFLITICKVFQIEASYDLQWNNVYTNHSFYFGIGGEF